MLIQSASTTGCYFNALASPTCSMTAAMQAHMQQYTVQASRTTTLMTTTTAATITRVYSVLHQNAHSMMKKNKGATNLVARVQSRRRRAGRGQVEQTRAQ